MNEDKDKYGNKWLKNENKKDISPKELCDTIVNVMSMLPPDWTIPKLIERSCEKYMNFFDYIDNETVRDAILDFAAKMLSQTYAKKWS